MKSQNLDPDQLSNLISCLLHTSHTGFLSFPKGVPCHRAFALPVPSTYKAFPPIEVRLAPSLQSMLRCPLSDHLSCIFLHIPYLTFYLHNSTCTCFLSPQTPATCSVSPKKVSCRRTRNQSHFFHYLPQNPEHAWHVCQCMGNKLIH